MIWYLLYPFRGTTEAPVLDPKHPLRFAFTRYGTNVARHPVITLLISVAAAVILTYPFPFLYTNDFTNGSSNLPHHVWTSAQPFDGPLDTKADVIMRSVWVHGSYMNALQSDVLQSALAIQDELLGPTVDFQPQKSWNHSSINSSDTTLTDLTPEMRDAFHASNGLTNSSWFFHSPLQYWSCSAANVAADKDLITTINQSSRKSTSVNVTLRHSIVFSGKRFEDQRLVAADAIVITLVHKLDSPVGRQWERKAAELAARNSDQWRLYPTGGSPFSSTLYEFRFQPLSIQDDLFLGVAYGLTVIYFVISLSKLRALRSRLGLIVAVSAQIGVSIMSSFTVCAIFKIDLSQIPQEAYPLVVLTIGLENIFRLINAVIITRSENSTSARIGEALGKTGHVAMAGVSQNLAILWILSRGVYPQITAFCTFAAIALSFDFFYLLTFFTAVLSVDVQRMELSDALGKVFMRNGRLIVPEQPRRQTWTEALLSGETPCSTRIAGTIVMIGFILVVQWHFFDNESIFQTLSRVLCLFKSEVSTPRLSQASPMLSVDIHQARTPTAWLQMQDHETAHEVIQVVKPHANRYIARVYDPLVFVLNGSDRTPNQLGVRRLLPAAYDFARNQFGIFILTVVIILAAVSLFMNYLLWDELPESDNGRPDDEPLLSIRTLSRGHTLDIILLTTSHDGVLATVGLDRWIRIWDVRRNIKSYVVYDPEQPLDPFPVLAVTIDGDSNWLAILSAKDKVYLWNIPEHRWGPSMEIKLRGRAPVGFFFGYNKSELINPLIVVRHNGVMSELHIGKEQREEIHVQICRGPLVCARRHLEKPLATPSNPQVHVLIMSKKGCVRVATQLEAGWVSKDVEAPDPYGDRAVLSILSLPSLDLFLAARDHAVDLIDILTLKVMHTFVTKPMRANTLRCFHSTRRRPQCGSVGLTSLAIAYTCGESGKCILQSYLPRHEGDVICFRDVSTPLNTTGSVWREMVEHQYEIDKPGQWEAVQSGCGYLVGVRRAEASSTGDITLQQLPQHHSADLGFSPLASGLRRRGFSFTRRFPSEHRLSDREAEQDTWEVWAISSRGERYTQALCGLGEQGHLLISGLGPMEKMGRHSIVVGLGNMAKVISIGMEKFDDDENSNDDSRFGGIAAPSMLARRKRPHAPRKCLETELPS